MAQYFFMCGLLILLALGLDRLLGEPRRYHPLVGFGKLARRIERAWHPGEHATERQQFVQGVLSWSLAVVPLVLLTALCTVLLRVLTSELLTALFSVLVLYLAIGQRSLLEHGTRVAEPLSRADLPEARKQVGMIVSRNTESLDSDSIARAATESMLENGNDAVFGALFWFVLAGVPGVVLFRLANTLDAMWGYRNARYNLFGRCAAVLDDVLNFIPARLCALTYALLGNTRTALRCWREQAPGYASPNGGPVMAAGAGAIGVKLGGPACYHGRWQDKPWLGVGDAPKADDILQAVRLVSRGSLLWGLLLIALSGVV